MTCACSTCPAFEGRCLPECIVPHSSQKVAFAASRIDGFRRESQDSDAH
jgi:hypothetical protein